MHVLLVSISFKSNLSSDVFCSASTGIQFYAFIIFSVQLLFSYKCYLIVTNVNRFLILNISLFNIPCVSFTFGKIICFIQHATQTTSLISRKLILMINSSLFFSSKRYEILFCYQFNFFFYKRTNVLVCINLQFVFNLKKRKGYNIFETIPEKRILKSRIAY